MTKNRTTMFERVLALVLCAVMVLGMMPTGASALSDDYAAVSVISGEAAIAGSGTASVTATVANAELEWAPADAAIGRQQDGWWAGILVTAPDSLNEENAKIKYGEKEFLFAECKRPDDTVGLWMPVTVSDVEKGSEPTRTYVFDWDGDGNYEQTLVFTVDAATLTLVKDGVKAAPLYGTAEAISGSAAIAGSGTANMTATVSNATLEWVPEDATIGRSEGWWAGILVVAPAEFDTVTAKLKYGEKEFLFAECKREDNTVGLWIPVTTVEVESGIDPTRTYVFDWNGDGNYEQTLVFTVDTATVTLTKNGAKVCPLYSAVEGISGTAAIAGSGTANMTATVTEATLEWVPADPSIGRNEAGWWAGVLVTAPAGFSADTAKLKYGEKEFLFAECKREDNTVGLWIPVTSADLENGVDPTRTYVFDWNGDGNYEQTLTFKVKISDKIVLKQDGQQIYPAYGSATVLIPGDATVSGNDTPNVAVTVEKATLTWIAGDSELGRADGWWAGIKVTAPSTGFILSRAQFASVDANGNIGTGKSFDTYKDGADHIELWFSVSPEVLAKGDRTATYAFDWNGNGTYEQQIAFKIRTTGTTLLQDGKQVHPALAGNVTVDVADAVINNNNTANVTADLTGKAVVWNNGWTVTVTVAAPAGIEAEAKTFTRTFADAGTADINISESIDWDGNGYADQTVTVTGTVVLAKGAQTAPVFDDTDENVTTGVFSTGYVKAVANAEGNGTLTYAIADNDYLQIDTDTGAITVKEGQWAAFLNAAETGNITVPVTATFAETDTCLESSAVYTLTVGKNPDATLKFPEGQVTAVYGAQGTGLTFQQTPASGDSVAFTVTYASDNTDVATVSANGIVYFRKAGTVTITATATYDSKYTVSTASYTLTIEKGPQEDLKFGIAAPKAQTYEFEGQFANAVTGGSGTGRVTYAITSGDAATIDAISGTLTYVKAGTVVITATKEGDDCYKPQVQTYTLTINKAEQDIALNKTAASVINSATEYDVAQHLEEVENCVSAAPYVFTIDEKSATMSGTTINADTGVLSIGEKDYGTVTVQINRLGDDRFLDMAALTFTLTVNQMETSEDKFVITGNQIDEASGWFTGDATIQYTEDGAYQVGTHDEHDWRSSYALTTEGVNNIKLCVLKGEHDGCSHDQSVPTIKIDKTKPTVSIGYSESLWEKVYSALTFGYYNKQMDVTITAEDKESGSGLAVIRYKLNAEDEWTEVAVSGYADSVSFSIDPQYRGQIQYHAVDIAGNRSEEASQQITLIVDDKKPTMKADYDFDGYFEFDNIYYTRNNVGITLEITEENFDRVLENESGFESAPVVKINGSEMTQSWNEAQQNVWATDVTLDKEGDYVLNVNFTDKSLNEMDAYTKEIRIDNTKPEIVLESDLAGKCTNETITTVITINEHNFDPANTVITVSGKDINDGEGEYVVAPYTYAVVWQEVSEDVHQASVTLEGDAIYTLTVNSIDYAGNAAETATAECIVDKTNPEATISYSVDAWEKAVEKLTFGYYNADVTVTISAVDGTAGLKHIYYSTDSGATWKTEKVSGENDSVSFRIPPQYRDRVLFYAEDMAGNKLAEEEAGTTIVVDDKDPTRVVTYEHLASAEVPENERFYTYNNVIYTKYDTTATLKITEDNFDLAIGVDADRESLTTPPVVVVNSAPQSVVWQRESAESSVWASTVELTGEGDYILGMTFTDKSKNEMTPYTQEVRIDATKPVIVLDSALAGTCTNETITTVITINEHNFNPANTVVTVSGKDINDGEGEYVIAPYTYAAVWQQVAEDVHQATVTLDQDAIYTLTVSSTDYAGNVADTAAAEFVIDKTLPKATISYSVDIWEKAVEVLTFGYYNADVTVTISAEDITSGLHYIYYSTDSGENWITETVSGEKDSISFQIPPQYRNRIQFCTEDMAGNKTAVEEAATTMIVDDKDPTRVVTYKHHAEAPAEDEILYYIHNDIIYTKYDTTATLQITEDNFDLAISKDADRENLTTPPVVLVNEEHQDVEWNRTAPESSVWESAVKLEGEGDYVLDMTFSDKSKNEMTPYTQEIHIDREVPVITLERELTSGTLEALDRQCTNEDLVAVITVREHNFNPDATIINISGKNIEDKDGEYEIAPYDAVVEWEEVEEDVHRAKITLKQDAIYTITVNSTDYAGNEAEVATARFITEKTMPTNVQFSYETPVLAKVIEGITFGYYKAGVVVTVTADDLTSTVRSIQLTYNRKADANAVHTSNENHVSESNLETVTLICDVKENEDSIVYSNGGKTATAQFTLSAEDAQYFGTVSVVVTDQAGNSTAQEKENQITDTDDVIVVDNIKPIGAAIEWSESKTVLEQDLTVGKLTRPETTRYYDGDAIATVTIVEANFYGAEAHVFDNGEKAAFVGEWQYMGGDVWQNTVLLTAEGDHKLTVEYTDRSGNVMDTMESELIVIDHTNPVISLSALNEGQRHYYDAQQTITVTIKEHNFRESDVEFLLTSVNSAGVDLNAEVIYSEWTHDTANDLHSIDVTFAKDANYTMDVEYLDLSKRSINDLPVQLLTVDTGNPYDLTVTYSQSLVSHILDTITFGYYDAPVTVTIAATDDISGIREFIYSYIKHENVSGVNAELLNQSVVENIKQDGTTFSAEFTIPQSALVTNNQFNGYVDFTAIDNAGRSTSASEYGKNSVIVDNINPNSNVTYNDPVKIFENVAYYAGDINVRITINEANFYAQDVNVVVTRDGANYPVRVNWYSDNVNTHNGVFTLTEDGDYVVRVNYTDRSNNAMATYTSQQLTIDTKVPQIGVSKVINDSANLDEVYSFDITASDINFDTTAFNPVLTALIRTADGSFQEKKIDLGAMTALDDGDTYGYHIDNLEDDAIYFLSCSVTDLSGNTNNQMILEDGKAYTLVRFSINRNGSTFMLGEYTLGLVNDFYTRNVEENLEIIEINADVLSEHKITLNGKDLEEGTDYTVKTEGGNGKWMQYTYTINKTLFDAEGEYQVVASSKDKAGNYAFSDVKDATISFVVDRTAPVVAVTGMANDGRYQTEAQVVTLIPTDDGGALKSLLVRLVNEDGEPMGVLIDLSGEELIEALESGDGRLTFEIGQGLYQNVEIICEDCAVSAEGGNVYNETFQNLSVSTSGFMIFWANKPVRWSVIGGVTGLAALIAYLLRKKKKSI